MKPTDTTTPPTDSSSDEPTPVQPTDSTPAPTIPTDASDSTEQPAHAPNDEQPTNALHDDPHSLVRFLEDSDRELIPQSPHRLRPRTLARLVRDREGGALATVLADAVEPRSLEWLWYNRLVSEGLNLVFGEPSAGKGYFCVDLAARITRGAGFPDGVNGGSPGNVLILSAEETRASVIIPRLIKAGADLGRVELADSVVDPHTKTQPFFSLAHHQQQLRATIERLYPTLVILDPIENFMAGINTNSAAEVRQALSPLTKLTEEFSFSVVFIQHPNKRVDVTQPLYRAPGSTAFTAAARTAWLVARDPNNEERRLFLCVKGNYIKQATNLAFSIESEPHEDHGQVCWEKDAVTLGASDLFDTDDEPRAIVAAVEFIQEVLSQGSLSSVEFQEQAEKRGIKQRTLARARRQLGVKSKRSKGKWEVRLPREEEA